MVSLLCGLFVFLVTLLALNAAANNANYVHLSTRCIGSHLYDYKIISNDTIHLVHGSDAWHTNQIAVLDSILQNYDAHKVHLVLVGYNKSSEVMSQHEFSVSASVATTKKRPRKRREKMSKKELAKKLKESISKHTIKAKSQHKNLREVLTAHPDIFLETLNFTEVFNNSPLYSTWQHLNEATRIFAVRTIYLWQYGGLSFDLLGGLSRYKYNTSSKNNSIEGVVELGLESFQKLPKGTVTIDDEGWHMESRTSCHAFFGDMLMNLRKADSSVTPQQVIKGTLNVFCRRGSIDSGYCSNVKR